MRGGAVFVAAGIFLSRIAGFVRQRALAHYLGLGDAADVFSAAFRIPNFLQNLFGEGALSASFIPVYSRLLGRRDDEAARRVASSVAALLALTIAILVLAGMMLAPVLVAVFTPGFTGDKRDEAIRLVRVLYPGAGLLALSAWCLGVLNSHRRFLLPYAAPVVWNLAIVVALVAWGQGLAPYRLAELAGWGSVAGSALQLGIQLPLAMRLAGGFDAAFRQANDHLREVLRNFAPAVVGRGVVQVSGYVDTLIASLLPGGAVAAVANAQMLYTLPVSLFGMSVSAAELPELSRAGGSLDAAPELRGRLEAGLRRIAFFVVPSAVAFLALGDVAVGALFETGRFTHADSLYVWAVLAGYGIGLFATTQGRLCASVFYALGDTRTPLRFALVRVALGSAVGWIAAKELPVLAGIDPKWGAAGLSTAAALAGWTEFALLRRALGARLGGGRLPAPPLGRLLAAALLAAAAASALRAVPGLGPLALAATAFPVFGGIYWFACPRDARVSFGGRSTGR